MSPQLECSINYQTTVLLFIPGIEQDGDYCRVIVGKAAVFNSH